LNILHINTFSKGGAFTGAYRLHEALLDQGIESTMLVRNSLQEPAIESVRQYNVSFRRETLLNRISFKLGFPVTAIQKKKQILKERTGEYEIISFPFSNIDITKSEAYKNADIIHLHWVGDYLDYKSFFATNTKPVVWTIRDAYPFQGIFHMERDIDKNDAIWNKINKDMLNFKKVCISKAKSSLSIVGLSNYITERCLLSGVFNGLNHQTIPNCIDVDAYSVTGKRTARKKLNINDDSIIFSFVADYIDREGKGFKELKEAIESYASPGFEILTVGENIPVFASHVKHRHFGHLEKNELSLVYAASDAFIFPTKEEALGNVMLEAMACGTPVIGTPVGGLLDVIKDGFNGILTEGTSANDIKKGIDRFMDIKNRFDSDAIKAYVAENFSPEKISGQYITLYRSLYDA
jgi:glycosyltransferase involved in cell wall biosynthesis